MNLAWLLEVVDFTCVRCGKRGVTTFTDMAGLEAYLSAPTGMRSGFGHVDLAGLTRFGPVHSVCRRDRVVKPCPYDLAKSVR